jgi:hypothetical protein
MRSFGCGASSVSPRREGSSREKGKGLSAEETSKGGEKASGLLQRCCKWLIFRRELPFRLRPHSAADHHLPMRRRASASKGSSAACPRIARYLLYDSAKPEFFKPSRERPW